MDSSISVSLSQGANKPYNKPHIKEVVLKEGSRAYQAGVKSIIGCSENGKQVLNVLRFLDGSTFGSTPHNIKKFFNKLLKH